MTKDSSSLGDLLGLIIKEGKRRVLAVAAVFAAVALLMLAVGLILPKKYDAQMLLRAESNDIMKPLMTGREQGGGLAERAQGLVQVVGSKRVMREILLFGGWMQPAPAPPLDPRVEDRLINQLRSRIRIEFPSGSLVRIGFRDTDPHRTYKVCNHIGEIFIREAAASLERESKEAYDFIDQQVKEYADKLSSYHAQVLAQYQGDLVPPPNDAAAPDAGPGPAPRPERTGPRISAEELAALRAEEQFLESQLNSRKPAQRTDAELRQTEDTLRNRALQLEGELNRLLSTYTDEHPDVRRVRRELDKTREDLRRAQDARLARDKEDAATAQLDADVARVTRERLTEVRRRIAAATGTRPRPVPGPGPAAPRQPAQPEQPVDPEMRGIGRDTTLSELLRRYEATREVYQDLLIKREAAKVNMEMDAQRRGFSLTVEEPAEVPVAATGLRLSHFAIIGILLGCLAPIGLLFAIVKLDGRVRAPSQIEALARVPLLVSISFAPAHVDKSRSRTRVVLAALMVVGVFAVYAAAYFIKSRTTS